MIMRLDVGKVSTGGKIAGETQGRLFKVGNGRKNNPCHSFVSVELSLFTAPATKPKQHSNSSQPFPCEIKIEWRVMFTFFPLGSPLYHKALKAFSSLKLALQILSKLSFTNGTGSPKMAKQIGTSTSFYVTCGAAVVTQWLNYIISVRV